MTSMGAEMLYERFILFQSYRFCFKCWVRNDHEFIIYEWNLCWTGTATAFFPLWKIPKLIFSLWATLKRLYTTLMSKYIIAVKLIFIALLRYLIERFGDFPNFSAWMIFDATAYYVKTNRRYVSDMHYHSCYFTSQDTIRIKCLRHMISFLKIIYCSSNEISLFANETYLHITILLNICWLFSYKYILSQWISFIEKVQ